MIIISFFSILAVIAMFTILGFLVQIAVVNLRFQERLPALLAVSYLIGSTLFTLSLFLAHIYLKAPINLKNILLIYSSEISLLLIFILLTKNKNLLLLPALIKPKKWKEKARELIFNPYVLIISCLVVLACIFSLYWPVNDWDSLALYDFRARVFYATGYMNDAIATGYFWGYPLHTSLIHTVHYLLGGSNPTLFYVFYYVALLLIFNDQLQQRIGEKESLIWTTVLALSFPLFRHSFMSYTNLPYTTYLISGFLLLFDWVRLSDKRNLLLASFLFGGSVWIRNAEPFWLIAFVIMTICALKKRNALAKIFFTANFLLYLIPWATYKKANLVTPSLIKPAHSVIQLILLNLSFTRMIEVLTYSFIYIIADKIVLFVIFLIMCFFLIKKRAHLDHEFWPQWLTIILILSVLMVGIYYFSIQFEGWVSIGGSVTRISMILLPLLLFFSATVYHKLLMTKE